MPYALIPDNHTLKKVTSAQEAAVHSKRRHDDVVAFLGNEGMPKLIVGGAILAALPIIIPAIIAALSKQIPSIPDDAKDIIDSVVFVKDLNEVVLETLSVGIFEKGETKDFYDKYVKK